MRGLTLRITNPTATRANITDIPGVSSVGPGETIEVLYSDAVQQSLEYGTLNTYLASGGITATFVSGSLLSAAPVGATMVGATPTTDGTRGLVPRPAVADRGRFLKGDGTWAGMTALAIGAIPESKLTAQGDLLFRGVTTSERLPLGDLGQVLRAGVANPQWQDMATSGTLLGRPLPGPSRSGTFYWGTDTLVLYVCAYNGTSWSWIETTGLAFDWVGTWSALVSYTVNQGVIRGGNAYVALTDNTNSPPESNPSDWAPMTDVSQALSFLTVNGDMVYRNASGVITRLPVGTPGQYLTAQPSGMSVVPTWTDLTIPDIRESLTDLSGVLAAVNSFPLYETSGAYSDNGTSPQTLTDHGSARRGRLGPRSIVAGLWPDTAASTGLSFPATPAVDKSFSVGVTVVKTEETFVGGTLMAGVESAAKYVVVTITETTATIRSQNGITTVPVTVSNDLTRPTRLLAIHTPTEFSMFVNGVKVGPILYANDVDINSVWLFSRSLSVTNAGFGVNNLDYWDAAVTDADALLDYERYAQAFVATRVPTLAYTETNLASNASVDGTTANAWFTVGSRRMDPANYPNATMEFCAEGVVSGGGLTGDVRLYDATNTLALATHSFTNTSPTVPGASQRVSVAVPTSTAQWLVQIRVTASGLPGDSFNLTSASVAVTAS